MSVSFKGLNETVATFRAGAGVTAGAPVKVTGEGTVAPCGSGDDFAGIALSVREGYCAVLLSGYIEAAYSGAAPAFGKAVLAGDGAGKLKTNASGRAATVLHLDTAASVCGILL